MATPKKATQPQTLKQSAPPTPNVVGGYSYPDSFPYTSVSEVVRIVKSGDLASEKAAFGKHIWVVQGYAQSMLLGDPDKAKAGLDFNVIGVKGEQKDIVIDLLDSLLKQHDQVGPQALETETDQGLVKCSAGVPMAAILKWSVGQLLTLLEQELAGIALF